MKPWEQLTALERREAIARRLGWTAIDADYQSKPWEFTDPPEPRNTVGAGKPPNRARTYLRDWPTNDGLAFTEVWPLLCNLPEPALTLNSNYKRVNRISLSYHPTANCVRQRYVGGDSWADAICRGAYILLPEESVR